MKKAEAYVASPADILRGASRALIFLSQVIFVFLWFFGMVTYDSEVETKEKQKLPEIKN